MLITSEARAERAKRRAEHTKLVKAATRKLARRREAAAIAETEYRQAICSAFAAGLTAKQIHEAAGISTDRAYQIKRGVR